MSRARQRLGRWGERVAARFLRRKGLKIIARNWRCTLGEVDLIARDGNGLVVVEVRTARTAFATSPVHTVGPSKQRKLCHLAERYRMGCGWKPTYIRFDVIGIVRKGVFRRDLNWVRNAFEVTRS